MHGSPGRCILLGMWTRLHEQITNSLALHSVCILSANASGETGAWAIPVRCRSHGLNVECLLPRWADAAFYLEKEPHVLLIFQNPEGLRLGWLQYRGRARLLTSPNWAELLPGEALGEHPEDRYIAVQVQPSRIDVVDESRGWGLLESLEF